MCEDMFQVGRRTYVHKHTLASVCVCMYAAEVAGEESGRDSSHMKTMRNQQRDSSKE